MQQSASQPLLPGGRLDATPGPRVRLVRRALLLACLAAALPGLRRRLQPRGPAVSIGAALEVRSGWILREDER